MFDSSGRDVLTSAHLIEQSFSGEYLAGPANKMGKQRHILGSEEKLGFTEESPPVRHVQAKRAKGNNLGSQR
ncbi:MAG: hypothetical protein ABL879_19705, partial [Devosia sp.]